MAARQDRALDSRRELHWRMQLAPFKAGVQAQQNSEFGGSSDIIHRKDGVRECANFVRPAMSRIQSIARSNFAGRHSVP